MRFDYSHSFVLVNRVCATVLLIFLRNKVNCIFALDVLLSSRDSNVYIKTAVHWFQFPHIQELTSPNFTSFIWQCYWFSVHSVLFIILKIILVAYLNKELSLWWIFSYLVLLIGGLENERSATIFYWWQVNTYIHTNIFQKSERSGFVV